MRHIGVLGGTFDPLHLGHLRAAEVVRDSLTLDSVLFVPAAKPPHKTGKDTGEPDGVTEAVHRLRMVERALASESFFRVSRIEVERGGPSYTIETLELLQAELPSARFYFVTGTDAFAEIRSWHRWRELLSRYSFVVHERPGFPLSTIETVLPEEISSRRVDGSVGGGWAEESASPAVYLVRKAMLDISSTEIRRSVKEGRSIRFLVPDAVEAYVRQSRLYL